MTPLPRVPDGSPEAGYAYLEHTADIRLLCWGRDFPEAVSQALLGTAGLMVAPPARRRSLERSFRIEADDMVGAAVRAVNELLFLFETDGLVLGDAVVEQDAFPGPDQDSSCILRVALSGDVYHPGGPYAVVYGVKAATYHGARVEEVADRWTLELILDV